MANYGDVALNLPANWTREANLGKDQDFVIQIVGHSDGVADMALTKEPDAQHQFYWLDMKDDAEVSRMYSRGFSLVTQDKWTKNEHLWRWDDQDFCVFNGRKLAARPAHLYHADKVRREQAERPTEELFNDKIANDAATRGALLHDTEGRPLQKAARR